MEQGEFEKKKKQENRLTGKNLQIHSKENITNEIQYNCKGDKNLEQIQKGDDGNAAFTSTCLTFN